MRFDNAGIGVVGAIALASALAGCGSGGDDAAGSDGADAPLKVALVAPSAGAYGVFGTDAVKGWKLAADEVNAKGGIDGHRVEITTAETDGTPAATVRAARKATLGGARYISGIVTSGENAALAPQLTSLGALNLVSMSKDDSLTGKDCNANMYRTTISTGMDINATAGVLRRIPGKRWAVLMTDTVTGHSAADTFAAEARKAGKQIVSTQYSPFGTTEFGSYITKIKNSGADSLFAFESAGDGVAFINQAQQFRLFKQVRNVVGFSMVSEPVFRAVGDTVVGFYNNLNYSWRFGSAANKAFVAAYEAKYEAKPYFIPAENYVAAQVLFEAVRKAKSVDVAKVKAALGDLDVDTISGNVQMRAADHQALRDTYVGQIIKDDEGLGWKVVSTVPAKTSTPAAATDCRL